MSSTAYTACGVSDYLRLNCASDCFSIKSISINSMPHRPSAGDLTHPGNSLITTLNVQYAT